MSKFRFLVGLLFVFGCCFSSSAHEPLQGKVVGTYAHYGFGVPPYPTIVVNLNGYTATTSPDYGGKRRYFGVSGLYLGALQSQRGIYLVTNSEGKIVKMRVDASYNIAQFGDYTCDGPYLRDLEEVDKLTVKVIVIDRRRGSPSRVYFRINGNENYVGSTQPGAREGTRFSKSFAEKSGESLENALIEVLIDDDVHRVARAPGYFPDHHYTADMGTIVLGSDCTSCTSGCSAGKTSAGLGGTSAH